MSVAFSSAHASDAAIVVDATLGEHFILWEWVTALLGYSLEVNPFDQPNVTEAKERTGALLEKWRDTSASTVPTLTASFEDDDLAVFVAEPAASAHEALATFFAQDSHYVAIMAYLARGINDEITGARELIANATGRGTTFGWGPRFLHSTGQFHKGGQHNGAFVQITGENHVDLAIPGKDFSFHTLLMAQALGDGEALASRGFPVIRIHLKNRERGVVEVLELLRGLRREA